MACWGQTMWHAGWLGCGSGMNSVVPVCRYDGTVRNSTGAVVQFLYGEDGMDGTAIESQRIEHLRMDSKKFRVRLRRLLSSAVVILAFYQHGWWREGMSKPQRHTESPSCLVSAHPLYETPSRGVSACTWCLLEQQGQQDAW